MKNNSLFKLFFHTSPPKKKEFPILQSKHPAVINSTEENNYNINLDTVNLYDDHNDCDHTETQNANWYGKGSVIDIQGYKITNPLVYVTNSKQESSACHIIPKKLKASSVENYDHIGYWPSYSKLNASQRGIFLRWLSEEKNNTEINIGYVFIYFYGLEYRVLKEHKDLELIGYEIIKLWKRYASDRSFQQYSERLLAYIISNLKDKEKAVNLFKEIEYSLSKYSIIYQSGIHLKINNPISISVNELISLIPTFESVSGSCIPRKVGKYFNQYFKIIAKEEIEEAITCTKLKEYAESYWSASNFITGDHYYKGIRIIIDRKIQSKLAKKWNKAIEDFRPYSRKLNKYSFKEIFGLLPEEFKRVIDHPLKNKLKEIATNLTDKVVTISEIANSLGMDVSEKLTSKECKEIINTLLHENIIIEPNAIYFKKNYKKNDLVCLSQIQGASMLDTHNYKVAALMADLGVDLAYSDNDYSEAEAGQIYLTVKSNFLSTALEYEHLRLRVELYKTQRPNVSNILKKISKHLKINSLERLINYLVGVALSDGTFTKEEDRKIRSILSKLGIRESYITDIYERFGIHETFENIELKSHQNNLQKGSPIPKKQEITLDQKKIDQIKSDTEEVKLVLSKIIREEEQKSYIPIAPEENKSITTLNKNQFLFLRHIVQQDNWDKRVLRNKAREHGFMVNAIISTINEWTEENYGDYLIFENGNNFEINHLVLEDMNAEDKFS